MPTAPESSSTSPEPSGLTEIRYSLPALLAELQDERAGGTFAIEKLHQTEIDKLFLTRKKRRVKKT